MATRQSTIDFILDQLASLERVRAKKMFGEYAIYCDEKVVALVCDDQCFLKPTPIGKSMLGERYEEGYAYPGAKPSIVLGADELENHERLSELILATAAALPPAKPKRAVAATPKQPSARTVSKVTKSKRPSARTVSNVTTPEKRTIGTSRAAATSKSAPTKRSGTKGKPKL